MKVHLGFGIWYRVWGLRGKGLEQVLVAITDIATDVSSCHLLLLRLTIDLFLITTYHEPTLAGTILVLHVPMFLRSTPLPPNLNPQCFKNINFVAPKSCKTLGD